MRVRREQRMRPFRDRANAGQSLAEHLQKYANKPDVLVLGLPRGGIEVAYEVALSLNAPLDALLVRKLGVPGREELAMGAVSLGGACAINEDVILAYGISERTLEAAIEEQERELERRNRLYRDNRPPPDVHGLTLIIVDDGLATGATMRAAIAALREQSPARIVVAVPVGSPDIARQLGGAADEVVCPLRPESFFAISLWYDNFEPTPDDAVRYLLQQTANRQAKIAT